MATLIICPVCETRYETKAVFPPEGRKVRCSKCTHVWLAKPVVAGAAQPGTAPQAAPRPTAPPMPPQPQTPPPPQAPMQQAPTPQAAPPMPQPAAATPAGGAMPGFAGTAPPAEEPRQPSPSVATPSAPEPAPVDWSPPAPQVDADFEVEESLAAQVAEINAEAMAPPPPPKKESIFAKLTRKKRAPEAPIVTETEPERTDAALAEAALAEAALADAALADAELVAEAMGEKPAAPIWKRVSASPVAIGWAALALVLVLLAGMFLFARDTVMAVLPGASSIYGTTAGTEGLAFENVRYDWTSQGGQTVLEVQGNVRNVSSSPVTVPTVVIALRDEKGEEISEWTTEVGEPELAAGQEAPFLRQIPSPPSNVRSLKVRFAKAE